MLKHAVRFQELAGADVCSQRLEDSGCKESTAAVAGIHGNLHAFQRPFPIIRPLDYQLSQVPAVRCHDVSLLGLEHQLSQSVDLLSLHWRLSQLCQLNIPVSSVFKDCCYVLLVQSAIGSKELESVSVIRQMAGSYHNCSVAFEFRKYCGHEHSRCGCQIKVIYPASVKSESVHKSVQKSRPRGSGISSYGKDKLLRLLAELLCKPDNKAYGNVLGFILS